MLVLSRHRDESIIIGDDIVITVVDIRGDKVRLGIQAPTHIPVHRQEIYEAIQREKSLKRYRREWKMKLIEEFNPTWMDLFEQVGEMDNVYRPHRGTRMWDDYN